MTKEERKEYSKRYRENPVNKEKQRLRNQTPERKEIRKMYREIPENKEYKRLYDYTPVVKEKQRLYSKSNKDGLIYTITNPIGEVYIGATKMLPNVRWRAHKSNFKSKPGEIPLLHQSFEKWGIDTHVFKVIENHGDITRNELLKIEFNMIKNLSSNGMGLNVYKINL